MSHTPADRYGTGLNLTFNYDPVVFTPVIGDRVKIVANRKVGPLDKIGDPLELPGEIIDVRDALSEVTIRLDALHNRQDRIAGEAVSIGRGVFGPGNKIYQYTPAAPARHDGTTTGPKTVTVDVDDTIKITVEGTAAQTIVITAGVGLTFAAIAEEVNATLTGAHLEVDAAGNVNLVCDDIFKTVEVGAVATDAYTLLGWTAAVYKPDAPSHDPCVATQLIIVGGAKDAAIETLER
jgi:hypothetical protein